MISLSLGAGFGPGPGGRPEPGAPGLTAVPRLSGPGLIGMPLQLDPGLWQGEPAPLLALQWQRDGTDIPGATDPTYLPGPSDDGAWLRARVTAANTHGAVTVHSTEIRVTYAAPTSAGGLPDRSYPLNSGNHIVNAFPDFTGDGLTFRVIGEGVSIDPATGEISISTEALRDGIEIVVTAGNSGGEASSRFRLTVAAEPAASPPSLVTAPSLAGSGLVGEALSVDPGIWAGEPLPGTTLQWRCDGADLPGATEAAYVPGAAEDGKPVTCRVTATNASGSLSAETAALTVTRPAPAVAAVLADVSYVQGSGPQGVDAGAAFSGGGLVFAVEGGGAAIDPATGQVTLPTDALRDGETVRVTASNSGGEAEASFAVTVARALSAPVLLAAPSLLGNGKIDSEVIVDTGIWEGVPTPDIAVQWLRDGAEIPGATWTVYIPGPADDRTGLSCRVTASNAVGSLSAETGVQGLTFVAPAVQQGLADVSHTQGSGVQTLDAAAAFAGEGLGFAVTGGGAGIDPATGLVSLPTDTVREGETVRVTASNSGGSAEVDFRVTIVSKLLPPVAVGGLADVSCLQGSGVQTVAAQAGFAGEQLSYALEAAPPGVTIDPASGLVSIATDAALSGATVIVRAANAAGGATQSFAVTVRQTRSVFDQGAALGDMTFLAKNSAPSWSYQPAGFARFVPAADGRAFGDWVGASGDGLYRCLARWNASNADAAGYSPMSFGARVTKTGTNFAGIYLEFFQPSSGARRFRIMQFADSGTSAGLVKQVYPGWEWNTWYWIEMEIDGPSMKARFYAETAVAPDWQLQVTTTLTGPGAFGPGGEPRSGGAPQVDIRRIEYRPLSG